MVGATLLVLVTGTELAIAQPAQALPGLVLVSATSSTDSSSSRLVRVPCPAGKDVTGVGAAVNGGAGQVALTGYAPMAGNPQLAVAQAYEDADGYAGNWSLTVYAICVNHDPSLTIVSATSLTNSSSNKGVGVPCPAGKQVLGLGGWITGGLGQVNLTDVYPTVGLVSAGALAFEVAAGYPGLWSLRVYAICIAAAGSIQQVVAQVPTTGWDTTAPKTVTVPCPPGTALHGLSARLSGSIGHETTNVIRPNPSLTAITVTAYADQFGQPQGWALIGIAMCDT